jgi:hypothetical protein
VVPGRARGARRPDKRPAQMAGTGRTRRRPERGEVEPMPGWRDQARGTRVPPVTGATRGARAARGERVTQHSRWHRAGRELITRGRAALAEGAGALADGRVALADGPGANRGQPRGGGPWGRLAGGQCGITYSGVWAMWHYLHSGLRRPGPLGRRNTGVLPSSRRAPAAKGGKGNFPSLRGEAKLPLPPPGARVARDRWDSRASR